MKITIVGATVPAKTLRAACAKADVPSKDVRTVGPRAWVVLPADVTATVVARLADALATGMMVVDIEMPVGTRGEGLQASRSTFRGVEEDVSEEARGLLRTVLNASGTFDDDAAAREIAWRLIGDSNGAAASAESNAEEEWAQALVDKLVADGSIELRSKQPPVHRIAHVLTSQGRDLGDRLLAELIESPAVDEVFADADQLAAAARAIRPKR